MFSFIIFPLFVSPVVLEILSTLSGLKYILIVVCSQLHRFLDPIRLSPALSMTTNTFIAMILLNTHSHHKNIERQREQRILT